MGYAIAIAVAGVNLAMVLCCARVAGLYDEATDRQFQKDLANGR